MPDMEKVIKHIAAEIEKICKKDFPSVEIDMLSDADTIAIPKEQVRGDEMDRLKLAIESLQTHIDYDNRANGMQTGIITIGIAEAEALLELLKEQENLKGKLLRNIADNQLAVSPTGYETEEELAKRTGEWNGLQMAYEIVLNDGN